jgi:DNA helicase HerA-like ATPase
VTEKPNETEPSPRTYKKTIDDPNAPSRLRGRVITATVTFQPKAEIILGVDMPDDYTPQEQAYLKWVSGELADRLREGVPALRVGEPRMVCPPSTREARPCT